MIFFTGTETAPLITLIDEDNGYDSFSNESDQIVANIDEIHTDYSAVECTEQHYLRVPRRSGQRGVRRQNRLTVPNARQRNHSYSAETHNVFSPSPLDPSPVSLLGGFMGFSVPSRMNDIFEDISEVAPQRPVRGQVAKGNENSVMVTAIVENTSKTRHPSGSIC